LRTNRFLVRETGHWFSTGVFAFASNTVFVYETTLEVTLIAFAIAEITADFGAFTLTVSDTLICFLFDADTVVTDFAVGTFLCGATLRLTTITAQTDTTAGTFFAFVTLNARFAQCVNTDLIIRALVVAGTTNPWLRTTITGRDECYREQHPHQKQPMKLSKHRRVSSDLQKPS
jgi:hypothetical protein